MEVSLREIKFITLLFDTKKAVTLCDRPFLILYCSISKNINNQSKTISNQLSK